MSYRNSLAVAATKLAPLVRELPEEAAAQVIKSWAAITDEVSDVSESEATAVLDDWLRELERRLNATARPDPRAKA